MTSSIAEPQPAAIESPPFDTVRFLDAQLETHFRAKLELRSQLSRQLVSFQISKTQPSYRWYKFKEAFSASLVESLLEEYSVTQGRLLDPFAGSGTALFAARAMGMDSTGIELLPIGQHVIEARLILERGFETEDFERLRFWIQSRPWRSSPLKCVLPSVTITNGAYSLETQDAIENFLGACAGEKQSVRKVLEFALLCVLESVSYTRKDGQYLRWDHRSTRRQGNRPFNKGAILPFDQAIIGKLDEIVSDATTPALHEGLFPREQKHGEISLLKGSCLDWMPQLATSSFDAVFTSPPYCNRYDYTRTYALELVLLGIGSQELIALRQALLSCTVENKPKPLSEMQPLWEQAVEAASTQPLLQAILAYLEKQKSDGLLNNAGIPRMVRGYFYEMACVIAECARVLKPGAPLFMVNDNVRYAGANISVDMILSSLAEQLGFVVEKILVLPQNKGNSSQQMGEHGRTPLRKCVYVWRKA